MIPLISKILRVESVSDLERRWRSLETRIQRPFFLSWSWIGTWLETVDGIPYLVAVQTADGRDIALGLFCHNTEKRRGVLRFRQMRLHEIGDQEKDAVTIEYNTLLCDPGMEEAAWMAAYRALCGPDAPGWDELIIGGAATQTLKTLGKLGLRVHRRAQTTSGRVDLTALRADGIKDADGFVGTLGKNTRSQIRRSMRLYAQRGPLTLDIARNEAEAREFWAELGPHHEAKWHALGKSGAFGNPSYLDFQDKLFARSFADENCVEILRARAGDTPFGWLYNFVDRSEALFYLSGFASEDDNKLKPGLVTHALAVERYLRLGFEVYDFMGGTNRYKASLGQPGPDMASVALQRPTAPVLIETGLRSAYQKAKALQSKSRD